MRLMQVILVALAAGLLLFAGYSLGRVDGFARGRSANDFDAPKAPSAVQTVVLVGLGLTALSGAFLLQGSDGVRVPTPARLDELTGRAEQSAVQRAERMAERSSTS